VAGVADAEVTGGVATGVGGAVVMSPKLLGCRTACARVWVLREIISNDEIVRLPHSHTHTHTCTLRETERESERERARARERKRG
jgi:hypothetical protein